MLLLLGTLSAIAPVSVDAPSVGVVVVQEQSGPSSTLFALGCNAKLGWSHVAALNRVPPNSKRISVGYLQISGKKNQGNQCFGF